MNTYPSLFKLFSFLLIASIFVSCKPHQHDTWKNDQIESVARDDFHKLNDQVMASLKANDHLKMDALFSRDLLQSTGKLRLIELCSNHLKDGTYELMDEYYVVHK